MNLINKIESEPKAEDVAIIGMSCAYAKAPDLNSFWKAVVRGEDCTRMVQPDEWLDSNYYDRQSTTFEKAYCGRGGFIGPVSFDPLKHGVMPNSVEGADTDQFVALKTACEALADAGIDRSKFNGEKAEVLVGRVGAPSNGVMNMIQRGTTITQFIELLKKLHPEHSEDELQAIKSALEQSLNHCSADSIPGVMPNILAGRIAGRLGFKGRSLVIDAACASSLIAVEIGVRDLQSGMCDLVLAGGVHVNSVAVFYQMFCGLGALSRREIISPFDDEADGTLLGDGVGMVVLKRLTDAVKDGDRIYAVIKGIGSSSDGSGTSMLAPSSDGEALAMSRAYQMAQVSPHSVALLEAHGTATPTGDITEMSAIQKIFKPDDMHRQWCALGSVKSNFGHTQAAAGVAGLIKTSLALYQKLIPPTLNVVRPNRQIDWKNSPCYLNQKARIWIHPQVHAKVDRNKYLDLVYDTAPRRAAVSAFGFGGVNAHAVLEEYLDPRESERDSVFPEWDSEVCLIAGKNANELAEKVEVLLRYLGSENVGALRDVAYTLFQEYKSIGFTSAHKIAIVASSIADLISKLELGCIKSQKSSDFHPDIYYSGDTATKKGKLAFVLPGLGASYPNMLGDLSAHFPEVRAVFDFVDQLALANGAKTLPSEKIFPNPFKNENTKSSVSLLANEDSAVIMLLMAEWALYTVLQELEIEPDVLVGVSTGEFAVLNIAGAADIIAAASLFYKFSTTVARSVPQEGLADLRTLKVDAEGSLVERLLVDLEPKIYLAAALSPKQSLVSGEKSAIAKAQQILRSQNIVAQMLPTAIPYHTPLVAGHIKPDNDELNKLPLLPPTMESWSCSMAEPYPTDVEQLRSLTTTLFTRTIRLQETVEKLYSKGVTKFIEVGPKGMLSPVISEILAGRPHLSVASNLSTSSGIKQLNHLIAALACHDQSFDLEFLFRRRAPQKLDFEAMSAKSVTQSKSLMRLGMVYPRLSLTDETANQLRRNFRGSSSQLLEDDFQSVQSSPQLPQNKSILPSRCALLSTGLFSLEGDMQYVKAGIFLSVAQHKYLRDHAIGGPVSLAYGDERVFLLPLTVALELMAEASACLAPDQVVVRLENIRATRRIKVGLAGLRIAVTAARSPEDQQRFFASIFILPDESDFTAVDLDGSEEITPAMSCEVVFAQSFSASPNEKIDLKNAVAESRPPKMQRFDLYRTKTMFHGPSMQSVTELLEVSRKQIIGTVAARDARDWLADVSNPEFVCNPLILDNATQLVLFHLFEHEQNANALLPFFVESIEIFADLSSLRGDIKVLASLNSVSARGTEADVALLQADGSVLAKFNSINSRRIALEEPWSTFIYDPISSQLQDLEENHALVKLIPESLLWQAASFKKEILPDDDVTLTWLMDYIFNQQEQRYCESMFKNGPRKREWVIGRLAAKVAVRDLILKLHGVTIALADIVVGQDEFGKPIVSGDFVGQMGWQPILSLSHKDNEVVALAAHPEIGAGIGIDLETIRPIEEGFAQLALTELEQNLLARFSGDEIVQQQIIAALWSSKEAAAKASGIGLRNNPKSIQIHVAVTDDGRVDFAQLWQAEILYADTTYNIALPVIIRATEGKLLAIASWPNMVQEQPIATTQLYAYDSLV